MVEFALILPILLIMMFGIIEFGRLLFVYTSITAASREAARYGAGIGSLGSGTILPNDCAGIREAATRIGNFAGLQTNDIQILHDTGPDTTQIEYCTVGHPTANFGKGDRIVINVETDYNPIVPLVPIPTLTLHSKSAHTILMGAEVVAVPEPVIPGGGGTTCDVTPYTVDSEDNPKGKINTIVLRNESGSAITINNILIVWDPTSSPVLQSMTNLVPGSTATGSTVSLNKTGSNFSQTVNWNFQPGYSAFSIKFSKVLKGNMIVRLTLTGPNLCSFGK